MKELHIYGTPANLGEFMSDAHTAELLERIDEMHIHFEGQDAKTPSAAHAFRGMEKAVEDFSYLAEKRVNRLETLEKPKRGELRQKEGMTLAEAKADFDEFGNVGAKRTVAGHEYKDAICKQCGKAFKSYHGRAKFCSVECKRLHTNEQKKRPKAEKPEKPNDRPEPSKAFEKEAAARAEGKRYADIQKADTLEKFGRVEK